MTETMYLVFLWSGIALLALSGLAVLILIIGLAIAGALNGNKHRSHSHSSGSFLNGFAIGWWLRDRQCRHNHDASLEGALTLLCLVGAAALATTATLAFNGTLAILLAGAVASSAIPIIGWVAAGVLALSALLLGLSLAYRLVHSYSSVFPHTNPPAHGAPSHPPVVAPPTLEPPQSVTYSSSRRPETPPPVYSASPLPPPAYK